MTFFNQKAQLPAVHRRISFHPPSDSPCQGSCSEDYLGAARTSPAVASARGALPCPARSRVPATGRVCRASEGDRLWCRGPPRRSSRAQQSPADLQRRKRASQDQLAPVAHHRVSERNACYSMHRNTRLVVTQRLTTANVPHASTPFSHHPR